MDEFEKFYNKALKFLSYRPRSEREIRDKLMRLKYRKKPATTENTEKSIIGEVVNKLKEQNFINDEEFVRWWVEQRTTFKPRSLKLIKIELRQKGIDENLINSAIQSLELRGQNDLEMAKKLVERKIERLKNLPKMEIYQKLGRFLAQKGFNWDTIKEALTPLSGVDEVLKG